MNHYCSNCGERLPKGATFCPVCGNQMTSHKNETPASSGIQPGFSDKINDPAIHAALKKNKKAVGIFALIFIPMPFLISVVLSIKDDRPEYPAYGAIVSAIFLLFSLISALKKKAEGQWDGVVIDKYTEEHQESSSDDDYTTYTLYIVKIRKENGRIKKLKEKSANRPYYDYLQIGDKVRYHPQFTYYYEKFDKSRDTYLLCPICASKNGVTQDTCSSCGVPLIK